MPDISVDGCLGCARQGVVSPGTWSPRRPRSIPSIWWEIGCACTAGG